LGAPNSSGASKSRPRLDFGNKSKLTNPVLPCSLAATYHVLRPRTKLLGLVLLDKWLAGGHFQHHSKLVGLVLASNSAKTRE
jgi:hypothetical protein